MAKWFSSLRVMTNATKAQLILAINALLGVAQAFDVALTAGQLGAIQIAVNAVLSLFVAVTLNQSAKRIDSPPDS